MLKISGTTVVDVNDDFFTYTKVKFGVLQGSVSALFFLIYGPFQVLIYGPYQVLFSLYMLFLGNIMGINMVLASTVNADDIQLYVSANPDESQQLSKIEEGIIYNFTIQGHPEKDGFPFGFSQGFFIMSGSFSLSPLLIWVKCINLYVQSL